MPLLVLGKYIKKVLKYLDFFKESCAIYFPNILNSKITRSFNVKYNKYFSFRSLNYIF